MKTISMTCPKCGAQMELKKDDENATEIIECPYCGEKIYVHNVIDKNVVILIILAITIIFMLSVIGRIII